MNTESIANNLLRLRKEQGYTQVQLAEAANLSRSAYRDLEKGRAEPRADTVRSLAEALKVPIRDLLTPVETVQNVRFRSLKRLKSRDQVLVEVSRWLRDFAELEDLTGDKPKHSLKPLWKQK